MSETLVKINGDRNVLLRDPSAPLPPYVGQPATIRLWTDTRAAVVTKINSKTIMVHRVEVGEMVPDTACDVGAYGIRPMRADGQLDKIIPGTGQRFGWVRGAWRNGSTTVTLGRSLTWVDYRD